MTSALAPGAIDLYWIPLGAGAHVVRLSGKVYEAITAFIGRRPRCALHHTALEVGVSDGRFVIESAPIRDSDGRERGVVAEGPVGTRWAGRFRVFRYEIRRWGGGSIPDANEAVSSPVRVANDLTRAQRVLDLVPSVPTPVWGRDEMHAGDMWNSNSLISWLLVRAGVDTQDLQPPPGGRAPGWDAGLVVARQELGPGLRADACRTGSASPRQATTRGHVSYVRATDRFFIAPTQGWRSLRGLVVTRRRTSRETALPKTYTANGTGSNPRSRRERRSHGDRHPPPRPSCPA